MKMTTMASCDAVMLEVLDENADNATIL